MNVKMEKLMEHINARYSYKMAKKKDIKIVNDILYESQFYMTR